jgi:CheY-like chemotaxis protein
VIERNAEAQRQLIEDLLDISRITTGRLRLEVRPVHLVDVVNAALDAARPAGAAKEIQLEPLLDPRAGPIAGDPDRLQQVVWNLLSNALKFTPTRGRVQVRLERIGSHVAIVVSDTGQGILPDVLPHVFEMFRQGDSGTTRRTGGLGLGLALVKHIVELHGGSVHADSAGPGQGATFRVELPLMIQKRVAGRDGIHPTAPSRVAVTREPRLGGIRVLLLDDDHDSVELLGRVLVDHEAVVRTAGSVAEAFDVLESWRPDIIVSDIEMRHADGYAFIERLRAMPAELGGAIPAIAVTAYGRAQDRVRALTAGFESHIPRPVEPAELLAVVSSLARSMRH